MQDYRVHIKHTDGSFEYIPYFCLPANDLNDVIAPSCYSCFDYPNALADLVSIAAVLCSSESQYMHDSLLVHRAAVKICDISGLFCETQQMYAGSASGLQDPAWHGNLRLLCST